jgi:hypothetical protein
MVSILPGVGGNEERKFRFGAANRWGAGGQWFEGYFFRKLLD